MARCEEGFRVPDPLSRTGAKPYILAAGGHAVSQLDDAFRFEFLSGCSTSSPGFAETSDVPLL